MSDYKDAIQAIFEDLIFARYDHTEYWKLPQEEQDRLYGIATREYADRMADRADYLRKSERER
jgi:hypothetical protein